MRRAPVKPSEGPSSPESPEELACPACEEGSPAALPFCVHCGAERALYEGDRGVRRIVTVVVCDLKGSTRLGERLDAESLREVMGRYIDEMRAVLEAHGGRVEKIIGDAIVAVFGIGASGDEDHALRAVRATARMQRALEELNGHLQEVWGVRLENRTGVCTGEVVVGRSSDGHGVITGEAMDMSTRMEQRAPPGGVLMTGSTHERLRARARTEPVVVPSPHGGPLTAHLLLSIAPSPDRVSAPSSGDGPASCPVCGGEDATGGAWCGWCGAVLRPRPASRDTRRTLTIVFADARAAPVDGSPAGPETLRAAMWDYFGVMRGILERHGATVEKYIGDAVMAVFGLPRRTEDDALRAVRAAAEMQAALPAVNDVLRREHGLEIEQRIGVNTGAVVAGDAALGQRLVTGDAVNVAARLEQAAHAGQVLLGEPTLRLVRGGVEVEALEPLSLKGKAAFVRAFRLLKVGAVMEWGDAADMPMVGRDAQLRLLEDLRAEVVRDGRAHMATILGDAGVGKTRLTDEFTRLAAGSGVRVLRGRCLSYGEGITFLPMVEVIREAAGIGGEDPVPAARAKLAAVGGGLDAGVADRVAALMGLSEDPYQLAELFWAVRRLLEVLGREGPVVVHLDDAHWAEETLLDLLEHLADTTEAPLLIVATSRPLLLERRPEWEEHERRATIALPPLEAEHAAVMVQDLLGDRGTPAAFHARIVEAAAGNPLFVEQLTSMLIDGGRIVRRGGRWEATGDLSGIAIPPTVEAILAARVDDLPADERAVLEPASVIGRDFARDAVEALAAEPLRADVDLHLDALASRQMVTAIPGEWPFDHRFHHHMIRDVAYDGLLKRARADLHERVVSWAEEAGLAREHATELEELLGYHLEQAHRYRAELGPLDAHGVALGRRAATLLGSAGRRSLTRGDMPTAANLLRRAAAALPRDDPAAPRLLVQVGEAEMEMGSFAEADATLASARRLADDVGEGGLAAIAQLERVRMAYLTGSGGDEREVAAEAERAVRYFSDAGDDEGLARAWRLSTYVEMTRCQWGAAERAAGTMIDHARRAGETLMATRALPALAIFILCGPTEAREGIARCEGILGDVAGDRRATALTARARAHLLAMRGDFAGAREAYGRTRADLEELGWHFDAALVSLDSGPIEMLAGEPGAAEAELRRDYEALDRMGERNYISTTAALLAEALFRQERVDEAGAFAGISREIAAEDDVVTQVVWRSVSGKVLSRRGRHAEGEAMCREAVGLIEVTDDLSTHAGARVDLAEALWMAGREAESRAELLRAVDLYDAKGNAVAGRRARALIGR